MKLSKGEGGSREEKEGLVEGGREREKKGSRDQESGSWGG